MTMKFKDNLFLWIKMKGLSRKEIIALLQSKCYEEFKGLDEITLSRWLNGKSTPPTYKQLYIAKILDVDLKEYIQSLDLSNVKNPLKYNTIVYNLTKVLDFSISVLSYRYVPKVVSSEVSNDSYQEHLEKFGEFYGNISSLKEFKNDLYTMGSNIDYKSVVIKNGEDEIIGHWSGILDIEKLNGSPSFITIPSNEIDKSCLVFWDIMPTQNITLSLSFKPFVYI
ncbi:helix-turn-helix domain-containing protein [Vibrio bathopelagicus]|uniref:helix-turn-helix domain-containing protein n=1 Tax=Vibrio bathopelagicus TaxID=2777577 RepID=UPI001CF43A8C|nr:helix-turn-helix transcriptional regulator [Vibrio bathopelagicus]